MLITQMEENEKLKIELGKGQEKDGLSSLLRSGKGEARYEKEENGSFGIAQR